MGGGGVGRGRGKYKKVYSRKGKLHEKKNDARQLILKNIHAMAKKIHPRNLMTKKNSCGSKIPLPPPNFSSGPSLTVRSSFSSLKHVKIISWYKTRQRISLNPAVHVLAQK